MPKQQTHANHARLDPAYHFFLLPVLLLNLFVSIGFAFRTFRFAPFVSVWRIVLAVAFLVAAVLLRGYALRVQDRVIRLEERLRLSTLLPSARSEWVNSLTARQWVALRFASDAELPALATRAAAERLTPRQIKAAVTVWRPDLERV